MYHENIGLKNFSSYVSITGSFALQGLKSSLPSPNGKRSCTVPSSSIAAANQEVSKLLPAGVIEHPTQSASLANFCENTKTESYHWKICYLARNKCCSMTLQEIISRIEIIECMWQQSRANNTEGPSATRLAIVIAIGNARNI